MKKMEIKLESHLIMRYLVSFLPAGAGDPSVPKTPPLNHTGDCVVMIICLRAAQSNTIFGGIWQ